MSEKTPEELAGKDTPGDITPIDNDLACGVGVAETGKWDPSEQVCTAHDLEYDRNREGLPNPGILQTTGAFIEGEAEVEAKSLYGVVTAPLYAALVTVVGIPLWIYESLTRKD